MISDIYRSYRNTVLSYLKFKYPEVLSHFTAPRTGGNVDAKPKLPVGRTKKGLNPLPTCEGFRNHPRYGKMAILYTYNS